MENMALNPAFWRGRRVLLTGHTGFKGSWLSRWLARLGAEVTGVSLQPATTPNLFELTGGCNCVRSEFVDIRDAGALACVVREAKPEVVFHLAAQALVRAGYQDPVSTFASNVMGSVHLLDALHGLDSVRAVVMVTTDKVYRNHEWCWPYRENDALGGHDPYSASKAASEIVIDSYRAAFLAGQGVGVASARAGNVIGGGDWAADRLLPDAVRAWQSGQVLEIRRPDAVRPWQHVLEPLFAYLVLAQRLHADPTLAGAYNFGPSASGVANVREVVELARTAYGRGAVRYAETLEGPHEAGLLALDPSKAALVLGINTRWSLGESVQRTMRWYAGLTQGGRAAELCDADIAAYEACV